MGRTFALYAGLPLLGWIPIQATSRGELQALALGLMVPGGGFLAWADPDNPQALWAIALGAGTVLAFVTALVLWFATGNVLLPVATWSGAALAAAAAGPLVLDRSGVGAWDRAVDWIPLGLVLLLVGASSTAAAAQYRNLRTRNRLNERLARAAPASAAYERAPYGLLACEPNWIYPLCNAITATAIRCHDAQHGTDHWNRLKPAFRRHLEAEFIDAAGRLVPFRSSLTGLAAPQIGGALMQAFPCLFLNAVLPDIARRQWLLVRDDLMPGRARRVLWPIDIGNYRISRASGYAAAAAAAVEMGDGEIASSLLEALDQACPREVDGGVAHRARASLWAHALEMMARFGHANALRSLVTAPPHAACNRAHVAPFIKEADYPDVLVAKAVQRDGALFAVLHPGKNAGFRFVTVGGLVPGESYMAAIDRDYRFVADAMGEARLSPPIFGRTELRINRCE